MPFDTCLWPCELPLRGALSLPEKRSWRLCTAGTWSRNNAFCLCKPYSWLQALMLICFSSSEGGRSNFGWATQNQAVDLEDVFWGNKCVNCTRTRKLFLPGKQACCVHCLCSFTQLTDGFVTRRPNDTRLQHQPCSGRGYSCVSFGDASEPHLAAGVTGMQDGWPASAWARLHPSRPAKSHIVFATPSCWNHLSPAERSPSHPVPRANRSIGTQWSRESTITKEHVGGRWGFPRAENVITVVPNVCALEVILVVLSFLPLACHLQMLMQENEFRPIV